MIVILSTQTDKTTWKRENVDWVAIIKNDAGFPVLVVQEGPTRSNYFLIETLEECYIKEEE